MSKKALERPGKSVLTFGAICVAALFCIEALFLHFFVTVDHGLPSYLLAGMILTLLVTCGGYLAMSIYILENEKLKQVAFNRHEMATHLNVVLAHINSGNIDRALAYARRVTFSTATEEPNLGGEIDQDISAFIGRKVGQLIQDGIQVEVEVNVQPHVLVETGVNPVALVGNLLDNAHQAAKGSLPGTRRVVLKINYVNDGIRLAVWNNGTHIPAENVSRVFDPGFTTKSGKNSGMGLAICKQIVDQAQGRISVQSSKQHGTLFDVFVPLNAVYYSGRE